MYSRVAIWGRFNLCSSFLRNILRTFNCWRQQWAIKLCWVKQRGQRLRLRKLFLYVCRTLSYFYIKILICSYFCLMVAEICSPFCWMLAEMSFREICSDLFWMIAKMWIQPPKLVLIFMIVKMANQPLKFVVICAERLLKCQFSHRNLFSVVLNDCWHVNSAIEICFD